MTLTANGPGGAGKPYKGDNPILPTTTDITIEKGTLITQPLIISAVEDLGPEIAEQTPVVTEILESLTGKVTLANATPETILEGYSAYVGRKLVVGTGEDFRHKIRFGEITVADSATGMTIEHGLGVTPRMFCMYPTSDPGGARTIGARYPSFSGATNIYMGYLNGSTKTYDNLAPNITETDVILEKGQYNWSGVTYLWVALA